MGENRLNGKNEKIITIITAIVTAAVEVIAVIIGNLLGYMDKWWTAGFFVWIVVWTVALVAGIIRWLNQENRQKLVALVVFFMLSTIVLIFVALWCNDKDEESTSREISSTITAAPLPTAMLEPTLTPTVFPTPTVADAPTPTSTPVPAATSTPIPTATCTPIPAHTHDYTYIVSIVKEPTCTSTGIRKNVCECGAYREEVIEKLGHTEVIDVAVAATCTESGLTEGKKCSVCGTVTVPQKEINAKGHTYDTSMDLECNNCGYIRGYWSEWIDNGTVTVSETDTRQVKAELVSITAYQYRYNRYVWYSNSGTYSSSKNPPSGYISGTVKEGSKTYSTDYSAWYDTAIEVVWKYYNGSSIATSTYNCDGIIYYNEEVKESIRSETHYFYRDVNYY